MRVLCIQYRQAARPHEARISQLACVFCFCSCLVSNTLQPGGSLFERLELLMTGKSKMGSPWAMGEEEEEVSDDAVGECCRAVAIGKKGVVSVYA